MKSNKKSVEDRGAGVQQGLSSREPVGQKTPRPEGGKNQAPKGQHEGRFKY